MRFDPFGERRSPTRFDLSIVQSSSGATQGYTGHEHDDVVGLINMGGRAYDSKQARFISPDPLYADPLGGPGQNRYSYVYNRPTVFSDPTGYEADSGGTSQSGDDIGIIIVSMECAEPGCPPVEGKEEFQVLDLGVPVGVGTMDPSGGKSDSAGSSDVQAVRTGSSQSQSGFGGGYSPLKRHPNQAVSPNALGFGYSNFAVTEAELDQFQSLLEYLTLLPGGGTVFGLVNAGVSHVRGRSEDVERHLVGAAVGLALGGAAIGVVKAAKGTTKLFRAVSEAEFSQLQQVGRFLPGPNSLAGKWFAESASDAAKWGEILNGKGGSRIIEMTLPKSAADKLMRLERLDGIGPARYGELTQLTGAIIREVK